MTELVLVTAVVILLIALLMKSDGSCRVCGAPANAQRHASECPWGRP